MFYNNEVLTVKNERTYNEKLKQNLYTGVLFFIFHSSLKVLFRCNAQAETSQLMK